MPGFLDFLFGADGPGGQPGAVGNTLNNGIANTVLGGVGKVIAPTGNAAVGGLGDWLADVTTKNPLEILKNPSSVLNDQGQVSLTRLAFPEFRRADVKAKKDQQKLTDLAITSEMYNTGKKAMEALGTAAGTPQGQQQAIDAGVDEDVAAQYGAAQVGAQLQEEEDARRQEAAAAAAVKYGLLPPEVAAMATEKQMPGLFVSRDNARAAADQRQFSNTLAMRAAERAETSLGSRDLRPPEVRRYDDDMDKYRTASTSWNKDAFSAMGRAEAAAEKQWIAEQEANPANLGETAMPPFPEAARVAAREAGRVEFEKVVPRPTPPESPFASKAADEQVKDAYPLNHKKNVSVMAQIRRDARALKKAGMDKAAAKYAAAFMHAIEHPEQTMKLIAPKEGEPVDAVVAKIKAGIHIFKPGNETMVMELLKEAGYDQETLIAAGDALDAEQ